MNTSIYYIYCKINERNNFGVQCEKNFFRVFIMEIANNIDGHNNTVKSSKKPKSYAEIIKLVTLSRIACATSRAGFTKYLIGV